MNPLINKLASTAQPVQANARQHALSKSVPSGVISV